MGIRCLIVAFTVTLSQHGQSLSHRGIHWTAVCNDDDDDTQKGDTQMEGLQRPGE